MPRKRETWQRAIDNLLSEFKTYGVDVVLYPDGCDLDYHFFPSKPTETRIGCFKNYARALTDLCNSDADIVSVLPDDLMWYKGGADTIMDGIASTNNIGYCAAYTPHLLGKRERMRRGWNEVKGGYYSSYGGAYFFPTDVARQVVAHPFFVNHRDNYAPNQQIDHCIPEVMHQLGKVQMFHAPSLVNHIGMTSTIGHRHTSSERAFLR